MNRSKKEIAQQIRESELRIVEARVRKKKLSLIRLFGAKPDAVTHIFETCVSMGFLTENGDLADEVDADSKYEVRVGQVVPSSSRTVMLARSREELKKQHRRKIPTKYLTLGGMSTVMLQERIRHIRPDWSKDDLDKWYTHRGQPEKTKASHMLLLEALTGLSREVQLIGDFRFYDKVDEKVHRQYRLRQERYNGVPWTSLASTRSGARARGRRSRSAEPLHA